MRKRLCTGKKWIHAKSLAHLENDLELVALPHDGELHGSGPAGGHWADDAAHTSEIKSGIYIVHSDHFFPLPLFWDSIFSPTNTFAAGGRRV